MERQTNQFDLPGFFYFQAMNVYTGSLCGMRFRIHEDERLHVAVWRSRLCFELAEMEAEADFDFTEDGYHAMLAWLGLF